MSHNEVSISELDKNSSMGLIFQNKGEFLENKRVKHRIMLTKRPKLAFLSIASSLYCQTTITLLM